MRVKGKLIMAVLKVKKVTLMNLKLLLRNLANGRNHTALNITGLALGMACTLVIAVKVRNELLYDRYLPDADRIHRLTFETTHAGNTLHFARCWEPWISRFPKLFPQIEELVRLAPYRHTAVKAGENKFYSDRIFATDSNFFKVFSTKILAGNVEKALSEPYTAVISASLAGKYFGNTDPTGKTIMISGEYDVKMIPFTITGVMDDSPVNSHIHFDILTSFVKPEEPPSWAYVYILLNPGAKPADLLAGIQAFADDTKHGGDQISFRPFLQKITDIHLHSYKDREVEPNGSIAGIYLYIFIALILMAVSWTNYFNLNRAKLLSLQKQTDIQRISGASRTRMILQAVLESAVCTSLALGLSIILIDITGSVAGSFFGFTLFPGGMVELMTTWPFMILLVAGSMIAGSLAQISNILSGSVAFIKKNDFRKSHRKGFSTYGMLLAVQFFLASGLTVSAITIYMQKELILERSLGKMSRDILVFKRQNWEIRSKYQAIRHKALQNPLIINFTASLEEPSGETLDAMNVESPALDEDHRNTQLYVLSVEDNFLDFFNIPLIAGSSFRPYNPERKGEDYILNETAVRKLGWAPQEAIGKSFKINFNVPDIFYGGTVTGVVKDFHYNTLRQEIKPYVLFQKPIFYLCFLVEVDKTHRTEAINFLKSIWEEELPDYPFQYEFINDIYDSAYAREFNQARLTSFFSVLAILLICSGLYSITSLLVIKRIREIGIRKVNGATIKEIIVLLSGDFALWFLAAFIIAIPAAWLIMDRWLQGFAYRTNIKWWFFAAAGSLVFSVSFLTIAIKSMKAASVNPAESLRYE
jgi:putative ABC transport system permease protein